MFGKISEIGKQAEQAGELGKKLKCKIFYIRYFSVIFNKFHLVYFNIIMYLCDCQNILSCIFQRVMQITHFHIGVQKYDKLYLWSA